MSLSGYDALRETVSSILEDGDDGAQRVYATSRAFRISSPTPKHPLIQSLPR